MDILKAKQSEYDELQAILKEIHTEIINKDEDINNDLRRALLTIADDNGNYYYYGYWWSFWNVVHANKRSLIDSNLRSLEFYI